MIYRSVIFSFFAFFESLVGSVAEAETKPEWREIYGCEGDEALVEALNENPSQQRFIIKNSGVRSYLGLDSLGLRFNVDSQVSGKGDPEHPGSGFRGVSAVVNYFWRSQEKIGPRVTAHIFPDHGGLKEIGRAHV